MISTYIPDNTAEHYMSGYGFKMIEINPTGSMAPSSTFANDCFSRAGIRKTNAPTVDASVSPTITGLTHK